MPNWCANKVEITLPVNEKDRQEFLGWLANKFTLNKILPQPAEVLYKDPTKTDNGLMPDWYNWCVGNWGTKWDVDAKIEEHDNDVVITFDSAWGPPEKAIYSLSRKFPYLHIVLTYCEPGMVFAGRNAYEDGGLCDEAYYNSEGPEFTALYEDFYGPMEEPE